MNPSTHILSHIILMMISILLGIAFERLRKNKSPDLVLLTLLMRVCKYLSRHPMSDEVRPAHWSVKEALSFLSRYGLAKEKGEGAWSLDFEHLAELKEEELLYVQTTYTTAFSEAT